MRPLRANLSGALDLAALSARFGRFLLAGAAGAVIQYIILVIMVEGFGWSAVLPSSLGYAVGALANYYLNYHLTFRSNKPHHQALAKFAIVVCTGLLLNSVAMAIGVDFLALPYLFAQVLTTGLVLIWNFTAHSLWSFRVDPTQLENSH